MLTPIVFFLLLFATVAAMLWSGYMLFREQEDPLGDRLEELQAHALVSTSARAPRRKGGGGVFNSFLYFISLIPGGDGWLRETTTLPAAIWDAWQSGALQWLASQGLIPEVNARH